MLGDIQSGRGSAPFTETKYMVKYFKPIPKEINQDASTVFFFFLFIYFLTLQTLGPYPF